MLTTTKPESHRWRFFRAGGFDQVKIETGADLMSLDQLDQKLWVALSCPISGLEFDAKTAALIDADQDGRIRAPELIAAVKWVGSMLKNPDDLIRGGDSLSLDAINDATPDGKEAIAAARLILSGLGAKETSTITVADATDANKILAAAPFNGDGVIVLESAGNEGVKSVFLDIASCMGTVADHSGGQGIDQAKADAFFTECAAYDAWTKTAGQNGDAILPAGDNTAAAAAAIRAIKPKIDDYFGRCRLAAFDPRTTALLNRKEEDYIPLIAKNISIDASEIAGFALAQIAPGKPLPLAGPVNPAHAAALADLREKAVKPLLGDKSELNETDWAAIQARLEPFETWNAGKAGTAVEKLGLPRIQELLASKAREEINALIAQDKALEFHAAGIAKVEKLARFVRDLHTLCLNFVNFKNLYASETPAIFQAGVLYLDQRSCHLCLTVEDASRHAVMAGLAGAYLAYVECVRKTSPEKMSIVAVFSQGSDDNLMVGRNGIFYDRKGRDYDATIAKILPNPISLHQAFWSPYKKLSQLIEEYVVKRAAAADAGVNAQMTASVNTPAPPAAVALPASKPAFDPSVIALLSVALGSLAAAFASVLMFLGKFPPWQLPLVFAVIMILISTPSLVLAFIKLRKRNLSPILDANGWAINSKAKINIPFGTRLTDIAKLPPGSSIDTHDRYAEKTAAWPKLLAIVFFIWWIHGVLLYTGTLSWWATQWDYLMGRHSVRYIVQPAQPLSNSPPTQITNSPAIAPPAAAK